MRGRDLAHLDSAHRPWHAARALRSDGRAGAGRRRALLASDRASSSRRCRFLKRLFERMSNAALERENPELASAIRKLQTVRHAHDTRGGAARHGPSDAGRTSRLHGGSRPAGGDASGAEPGGPPQAECNAIARWADAPGHGRAQEAEPLTVRGGLPGRGNDERHLVDEAPAPVLAGLGGARDRVAVLARVRGLRAGSATSRSSRSCRRSCTSADAASGCRSSGIPRNRRSTRAARSL